MKGLFLSVCCAVLLMITSHSAFSAGAAAMVVNQSEKSAAVAPPTPADVHELTRLLADPGIAKWLQQQSATFNAQTGTVNADLMGFRERFHQRVSGVRQRLGDIASSLRNLPILPAAVHSAWISQIDPSITLRAMIFVIIFLVVGGGLEWLFWRYSEARFLRIEHADDLTPDLIRAVNRAGFFLAGATIFSVGCFGAFVSFDWHEKVGPLVFSLLLSIVVLRFALLLNRILFAPGNDKLRLVGMPKVQAKNASRSIATVTVLAVIGEFFVHVFANLPGAEVAAIALQSLVVFVVVAVMFLGIWGSPIRLSKPQAAIAEPVASYRPRQLIWSAAILIGAMLHLLAPDKLKYTFILLAIVVPLIKLAERSMDHLMRQSRLRNAEMVEVETQSLLAEDAENMEQLEAMKEAEPQVVNPQRAAGAGAVSHRLLRFGIVICAVLGLAAIWGVKFWAISDSSTVETRFFAAAVDITVALLLADLFWAWASSRIDRRLSECAPIEHGSAPGPDARMLTLLPLIRKVLLVTVLGTVGLLVLSSFGVNIAPILAGAGVLGIAVGFGAQSLVKDIVSGVFFLFEDAFRVGEYIEMGDLRGTVESISIRSLRLRHHRGAVHTIPFGELTSLTNHSRDWAIIKLEFRVPFETDLKLVKKLVKEIGKELQANEDYGHFLIEPLKFQGVRRMEEFNMVVGVKFMSRPGEQWTIRRDAFQKVRDAFDANGLAFAQRNVKVEVVGDASNPEVRKAAIGAAQDAIEQQLDQAPVPDTP